MSDDESGLDWFDLRKYEDAQYFDIHDWVEHLYRRFAISEIFNGKNQKPEALEPFLMQFREEPVVHDWRERRVEYYLKVLESYKDKQTSSSLVCSISSLDVVYWARELRHDTGRLLVEFDGWKHRVLDLNELVDLPEKLEIPWHHRNAGFSWDNKLFLKVNLGASDEALLEAFKVELKRERALKKAEHNFRKPTAKRLLAWHRNMLLPYIDLTMWARQHKINPSLVWYGNKLFPFSEESPSEKVRKTTRPLADEVFDHRYLSWLLSMAHAEAIRFFDSMENPASITPEEIWMNFFPE